MFKQQLSLESGWEGNQRLRLCLGRSYWRGHYDDHADYEGDDDDQDYDDECVDDDIDGRGTRGSDSVWVLFS